MMKRILGFSLLLVLLITACTTAAPDQPETGQSAAATVTVYRSPT